MNRMITRSLVLTGKTVLLLLVLACPGLQSYGDDTVPSPWHLGIMAGRLDFEGDEAVRDTALVSVAAGYDLSPRWTIEAILDLPPALDENLRLDWNTGEVVSRLEENAGPGVHGTRTVRAGLSALYHLAPGNKVDPYVSAGAGLVWYSDPFVHEYEAQLSAGAGIAWKVNPQFAVRADARGFIVASASECNSIMSVGLVWTPAVKVQAARLDTDWDGLTDSEETLQYKTDPLNRDTDAGGVADGHEVIEDKTDPLSKPDDLELYELHIEFAQDSAEVTAQYYGELDVIGKILAGEPSTTARIEGHIDERRDSSSSKDMRLTGIRAESVRNYLAGDKWKIALDRMEAVGYGFGRPKEKPDLDNGNLANRRIEIYIRRPAK